MLRAGAVAEEGAQGVGEVGVRARREFKRLAVGSQPLPAMGSTRAADS